MEFYSRILAMGIEPDIHFPSGSDKVDRERKITGMPAENHSLDIQLDYDRIFRLVKSDVKRYLGKERAGLGLALSNLPPTLGAFWQVGGNYIVMNESLVNAMMRLSKSILEFNSYIYVILTHEYVHSLGYTDESDARRITAEITESAFGIEHHAYRMSSHDIWSLYPGLKYVRGGNGESFRIVSNFDSSSTSYIG